jgi:adenylate cyclase
MNATELQDIINWLIGGARSAASPSQMIAETCERLVQAGLPLWRVGVFIRTLHPEIFGRNFIWKEGAEVEVGSVDFEILDTPEFKQSPLRIVFLEGREVRGRIDDPDSKRFPFLDDMRAERVTDYIAPGYLPRRLDPCIELEHETSRRFH